MFPPDRGTRALRIGRVSIPGQIYWLTTVTAGRRRLFNELSAGRCLVRALKAAESTGAAQTLAYVVMPDHLHWLMSLGDTSLPLTVGAVKSGSAREIRGLLHLSGRVWQRGYHDHALRRDEALITFTRYLVANPVRAGLVRRVGDYPLWDCVWL